MYKPQPYPLLPPSTLPIFCSQRLATRYNHKIEGTGECEPSIDRVDYLTTQCSLSETPQCHAVIKIHSSIQVPLIHSSSVLLLGRPDRSAPSLLIRLDLAVHGPWVILNTLLRNDIRSAHHERVCSEDSDGNGAVDPKLMNQHLQVTSQFAASPGAHQSFLADAVEVPSRLYFPLGPLSFAEESCLPPSLGSYHFSCCE